MIGGRRGEAVAWRGLRPALPLALPGRSDLLLVAALALLVALGTTAAARMQEPPRPPDGWAYLLIVGAAGALAWRRVAPLAALAGAVGGTGLYLLLGYPYGPIQLCMVVAMFAVARHQPLPVSLGACVVAGGVAVGAVLPRLAQGATQPLLLIGAWTGWLIVPWALGALAHVRDVAAERLRRDLIARATLEERMWLAQEVHDGAGHGLAVIALQAGVALLILDEDPAQARKSLEAIRATSTQALDELRATLGTVQQGGAGHSATPGQAARTPHSAPAQDLPDLTALIDRVRAAGLPVDFEVAGEGTAPSREIALATYRIAQEALTNVLRHAGPTRAFVRITRDDDAVSIEIADRGRGPADAGHEAGHGLSGMRARVATLGGQFTVGPRDGGGFRVLARLPHGGETP